MIFYSWFLLTQKYFYFKGRNSHGQLGLNDLTSRPYPTQLRTLRNSRVRFIACGFEFSAFLTMDGGVFTCGAGMYGQLGHGVNSDEILPRQVLSKSVSAASKISSLQILELMGSIITQISCGRQHTLAFVPSRGRIYSFGLGGTGQLGFQKNTSASTPQVVMGPFKPQSVYISQSQYFVNRIFAGGDHCFATVTQDPKQTQFDCRDTNSEQQILSLNKDQLNSWLQLSKNDTVDQDIIVYVETIFRSLSCLNGSFLVNVEDHYCCTSKHHGVDLEKTQEAYSIIGRFENESLKNLVSIIIIIYIIRCRGR